MAVNDLNDFLVSLSKHKSLREAFAADPDGVGSEAEPDSFGGQRS